jgi:hypothetical protein
VKATSFGSVRPLEYDLRTGTVNSLKKTTPATHAQPLPEGEQSTVRRSLPPEGQGWAGSSKITSAGWSARSILRSKSDKFFKIITSLPDRIGYELFP